MRSEAVESRIRAEDIRWRVKQDRWQRHGLSVPALSQGKLPDWQKNSKGKAEDFGEFPPSGCCRAVRFVSGRTNLWRLDFDADGATEALGEGNDVEFLLPRHSAPPGEDLQLLAALDDLLDHFSAPTG